MNLPVPINKMDGRSVVGLNWKKQNKHVCERLCQYHCNNMGIILTKQ